MKKIISFFLAALMLITLFPFSFLVNATTETQTSYIGDINVDGKTNIIDYMYLRRLCFGKFEPGMDFYRVMDIDGDGMVDKKDYVVLKRYIFGTYVPESAMAPVVLPTIDSKEKLFDIIVNAPESYKNGDTITITITIDNITVENGIEIVSMLFNYDTASLSFISEINNSDILKIIDNVDNHCRIVEEGVLNLACTIDDLYPEVVYPENGEWVFTLEFIALADSDTIPDFSISNESIYGASCLSEEKTLLKEYSGNVNYTYPLADDTVVIAPVGDNVLDVNTVITANKIDGNFILAQLPDNSNKGSAVVYDISVTPAPESNIVLSIAVPEGMNGEKTRVWYIEDGTLVDMEATYENGYMVFETKLFGSFVIAENIWSYGDIDNVDGINKKDYTMLKRYCFGAIVLDETQLLAADINGDGEVDKKDYAVLKRYCFGAV